MTHRWEVHYARLGRLADELPRWEHEGWDVFAIVPRPSSDVVAVVLRRPAC